MSFAVHSLSAPRFRFSDQDTDAVSTDKFRGLSRYGPYRVPNLSSPPVFGFIFPKCYRELANKLYLAIRNGVGSYRGISNTFRLPLEKDQVFQVSDFDVSDRWTHEHAAQEYGNAVRHWLGTRDHSPHLFIVIHPRSPSWLHNTPYYRCKSLLLQEGFLSQDVTIDLLSNPAQFEWAAANIALAMFVKLGGVPWVIDRRLESREVVIGLGRSDLRDPVTRQSTRTVAFTTCVRADGPYLFSTLSEAAATRPQYLDALRATIREAISRLEASHETTNTLTLHVPKAFSKEESSVIEEVLCDINCPTLPLINVLQVTDEERFFAFDQASPDGIPTKGTCIQLAEQDYLLYSEGREERRAWRGRLPAALRVRHFGERSQVGLFRELLSQVLDLSQVNYRGFNATSRPVSIRYSELTARLLAHIGKDNFESLRRRLGESNDNRMWFL